MRPLFTCQRGLRGVAPLAMFLLGLGAASPAAAQEAPTPAATPTPHEAAIASFEEGTRLVTQGDCASAMVKFRESLAAEPGVGARLDLADCEERLGSLEAAWRDFRFVEHLAAARHDERAHDAHTRAAQLEHQLQLILVPNTPGIRLVVDGVVVDPELFQEGWLAVKPGGHQVDASAPAREPVALTLPTASDPGRTITIPPLPATAPLAPLPVAPRGLGAQRTLAVVLGAIGVAGVATGAASGLVTLAKRGDAADACGRAYPSCALSTQRAVSSANNAAEVTGTISTVGFVIGGAGLASGAVLFFTAPRNDRGTREALRVVPTYGADGTGAALVGGW